MNRRGFFAATVGVLAAAALPARKPEPERIEFRRIPIATYDPRCSNNRIYFVNPHWRGIWVYDGEIRRLL